MAVGVTLAGTLILALFIHAGAQGTFSEQRVRFPKGHNSATLRSRSGKPFYTSWAPKPDKR